MPLYVRKKKILDKDSLFSLWKSCCCTSHFQEFFCFQVLNKLLPLRCENGLKLANMFFLSILTEFKTTTTTKICKWKTIGLVLVWLNEWWSSVQNEKLAQIFFFWSCQKIFQKISHHHHCAVQKKWLKTFFFA